MIIMPEANLPKSIITSTDSPISVRVPTNMSSAMSNMLLNMDSIRLNMPEAQSAGLKLKPQASAFFAGSTAPAVAMAMLALSTVARVDGRRRTDFDMVTISCECAPALAFGLPRSLHCVHGVCSDFS